MLRWLIGLATIFALAGAVRAQETDEQARNAFESGREAFSRGDYETALTQFRVAYELSRRPGLLYNVAQSLDRLRRDEEALQVFRQYLQEVPTSRSRAEVEARIRVLEGTITRRQEEERARQAEAARVRELQQTRERSTTERETNARSVEVPTAEPTPPPAPPPLHPAFFIVATALAAGGVGVAIWTGLEAQSRLGPYTMSTTYDEAVVVYEDGVMYQSLATAFWIGSGAVAVGALVMAFFTDWGGSAPADQSPAQVSWLPTLQLSPAGGSLGVVGRF